MTQGKFEILARYVRGGRAECRGHTDGILEHALNPFISLFQVTFDYIIKVRWVTLVYVL